MRRFTNPAYQEECVFPDVPAPLNGLLTAFGRLECALAQHIPTPVGTSVFALCRRRGS